MPIMKVKEYRETVKENMEKLLGSDQKIMVLPCKDWDAVVEMTIIKRVV